MATQLTEPLDASSGDFDPPAGEGAQARTRIPVLIAGALLCLVLYAAVDHGGVSVFAGTRLEVAVAVLVAAALALRVSRMRAVPRDALIGLCLLGAFAFWSALTLLWSVAPDQTWVEVNRVVMYALVAGLAVAVGASHPRAPSLLANGFAVVAALVALYAIAQKLFPGLHVSGVFDLNQAGPIPRLQEPIGYWNALALFVGLGAPIVLHLANDARGRARRLLAAAALELMLVVVALTLSRGGLLALAVALVLVVAGSRERLRALAWLVLVIAASLPTVVVGVALHSLSNPGVSLGGRETGGAILAAVLAGSLVFLYLAGRLLVSHERRLRLPPGREQAARRMAAGGVITLVAGGVVAAALTHAWHHFTSPTAPGNINPSRLLTTDSYRWLWWKEAAHAFAARPVGGWGAGSFGVVHLIYRQNSLPVEQPHSLPLQFLSETGVVGALLGLGALTLLLLAAARNARRLDGPAAQRGAAVALLAADVAYLVHSFYDWDWNIPAVTLPAVLFIGALAGAGRRGVAARDEDPPLARVSLGTRLVLLTAGTLWLSLFALSALLPSLAASHANSALVKASSSTRPALVAAQSEAQLASSLDPLSDTGLRAEALIALHRGELMRARYELERALGREPSDELAWNELSGVDFFLGDRSGARLAAQRVVALDPRGPEALSLRRSGLVSGGA